MYWAGIDPGEHTGVAMYDGAQLVEVTTVQIHRALQMVASFVEVAQANGIPVKVVFEDARKRRWLPSEKNVSEYRGRLMGAGSVKRDCTIWEDFLKDLGVDYVAQAPRAGMTKLSAEAFARLTGWKGRTSNHARDAAMLVYGR
jgi:hypothetical protein